MEMSLTLIDIVDQRVDGDAGMPDKITVHAKRNVIMLLLILVITILLI